VFVLGVFFGLLVTIFCASFSINIFVLRWFNVTSDTSKVPRILRENLSRLAFHYNTISNTVGFLMCAFALYICV
jgi:large-conductance mechanosensitive channel